MRTIFHCSYACRLYPRGGPEEIVTDYLTKVFDYLLKALAPFSEAFRRETAVDIVATVPAVQ